jgi:hypothetical protein
MERKTLETFVKENGEEDTWKKNPWEVIETC